MSIPMNFILIWRKIQLEGENKKEKHGQTCCKYKPE